MRVLGKDVGSVLAGGVASLRSAGQPRRLSPHEQSEDKLAGGCPHTSNPRASLPPGLSAQPNHGHGYGIGGVAGLPGITVLGVPGEFPMGGVPGM